MRFMQRNTQIKDSQLRASISNELGLPSVICELLINRGIRTVEEAREFINPTQGITHDPFLMKDVLPAVERIQEAIENNERILIWGDYDSDGVTSSSIMYLGLKQLGANLMIHIPNRHTDGYGLSEEMVNVLYTVNDPAIDLVITVDCGISEHDLINDIQAHGIDVIVTDHHTPPEVIPDCLAVINPHQKDCPYPFNELCGAGVAFKVIEALTDENFVSQFYDLVALGTVADVMPLIDENRTLVARGLQQLNTQPNRIGFKAFSEFIFKDETPNFKASHFGFQIAPMINASGRMKTAEIGVELFLTDDESYAKDLVKELDQLNQDRKNTEMEMVKHAERMMNLDEKQRIVIVYGEGWNKGVLGNVASRLKEKYHCPTLVMSYDVSTNMLTGSGRSIPSVPLYDLLKNNSEHLTSFGGHALAAGFSLKMDQYETLKNKLEQTVNKLDDLLFERVFEYDVIIDLEKIDSRFIDSLDFIEPTGNGNPEVMCLATNVLIEQSQTIGKNSEHFRCNVTRLEPHKTIEAIAFNQPIPTAKSGVDVSFSPQYNNFRGKTKIQLRLDKILKHPFNLDDIEFNKKIDRFPLSDFGVTDKKEKQFSSSNIHDSLDLVRLVPKSYMDFRSPKSVRQVFSESVDKDKVAIIGKVSNVKVAKFQHVFVNCEDENGDPFTAAYFNQKFMADVFQTDQTYIFCGAIQFREDNQLTITPDFHESSIELGARIHPYYKKIRGMSPNYLVDTIKKSIFTMSAKDYLSREIIEDMNLVTYPEMLKMLHQPEEMKDIDKGQRRLVFDQLFRFALQLKMNEPDYELEAPAFTTFNSYEAITANLPYSLTNDQRRTVETLFNTAFFGQRVNALVQGDVGCGKSIVAFLLLFVAVENNVQGAMIAPTEVLARQHYEEVMELKEFVPNGDQINVAYLSGQTKAKEKREIINGLKDGSVHMVIGTHSLVSKSVSFKNLGLFIVDEEHKFGVAQREKLNQMTRTPHTISMSATPIPRSLAMSMYNKNIETHSIFEKPNNRQPVTTYRVFDDNRVNDFMLKNLNDGRQCYVVCPAIDGISDMKNVVGETEKLKKWFAQYPHIRIEAISGKMKKTEQDEIISAFKNNEVQILVSTTIIEVGVNVPNASVMLLKNSDRFGLAQAHQLRGRVGRGKYAGYCILQPENPADPKAAILVGTNNGFEIAQEDLKLRGTGDFIGTKQTGNNEDVALMLSYPDFFEKIVNVAEGIINDEKQKELYVDLLDIENNSLV